MRLFVAGSLVLASACAALGQAPAPSVCPCELILGDGPARAAAPARRPSKRLDALLSAAGSADASDVALVRETLSRLPERHVAQLVEQRTRVVVVRDAVTESLPSLANEQAEGWPDGSTFDDVPGLFHSALNRVVIAVQGHDLGRPALPRGGLALLHLMGHALDPSEHGGEGSQSAAFEAAAPGAAALEAFYSQGGARRLAEVYAESYARLLTADEEWFALGPALRDYWSEQPLSAWFVAPSSAESAQETEWDTLRPTLAWVAPKGTPTRYTLHVRDDQGQSLIVGDSLRDAFRRRGKHLLFTPRNLGLEAGRAYAWRVEAKSASQHAFSAWQRARVSPDAGRKQTLLQGGLPLPSVHATQNAPRVGTGPTPAPTAAKARPKRGLSDRLR